MSRLLILLLLLPTPLFASDGNGAESYDYPSRWGDVTFSHQRHQSRVGDCKACHHLGVELGKCGNCHGTIPDLPQLKDVLHKQCIGCHWKKNAPTECSGCHDPEHVDPSVYGD